MHTKPSGAGREPEKVDTSHGYERSDVRVGGVLVFLIGMIVFVAVVGMVAWGAGKILYSRMAREDGPASRWSKQVDLKPLGNMPTNPDVQKKMEQMTADMPEPKLQSDDGLQAVADLHAKEDLLLNHYTWAGQGVNGEKRVRIPIERAMQLVAQRGLPVAPAVEHSKLLAGESDPEQVTAPLTTGFVRTGYEQDQARKIGNKE